jgi:hypothetical protein
MRRGTGACGARVQVRAGGIDPSTASTPAVHSIARVDAADAVSGPVPAAATVRSKLQATVFSFFNAATSSPGSGRFV